MNRVVSSEVIEGVCNALGLSYSPDTTFMPGMVTVRGELDRSGIQVIMALYSMVLDEHDTAMTRMLRFHDI